MTYVILFKDMCIFLSTRRILEKNNIHILLPLPPAKEWECKKFNKTCVRKRHGTTLAMHGGGQNSQLLEVGAIIFLWSYLKAVRPRKLMTGSWKMMASKERIPSSRLPGVDSKGMWFWGERNIWLYSMKSSFMLQSCDPEGCEISDFIPAAM